jgi:O-antigen/teichoic acid export membrane protein
VARATGLSVIVDAILTLTALVSVPLLVNRLGLVSYGVLLFASVMSTQLGVLQFGIGPALVRKVVESRAHAGRAERDVVVWGGLAVALLTGGVAAVVATFITTLTIGSREAPAYLLSGNREAGLAFAVGIGLQPLLSSLQSLLLGHERYGAHSLLRLGHGLTRTGALLGVVLAGGDITDALWAHAVSDGVAIAAAGLAWWRPQLPPDVGDLIRAVRGLLVLGVPFALTGVVLAVQADAERLVMSFAGTAQALSFYAVPYGLLFRLNTLASSLATALLPRFAAADTAGQRANVLPLILRSTRVLIALVAVPSVAFIAIAPELLALWIGNDFSLQASDPARIAAVAVIVSASAYPIDAAIRASRRPKALLAIYVPQLPLLLVVYFAIRWGGVMGAALSLLLRCAVDALMHELCARPVLGERPAVARQSWPVVSIVLAFALFCATLAAGTVWLRLLVGALVVGALLAWKLRAEDWEAMARAIGWGRRSEEA